MIFVFRCWREPYDANVIATIPAAAWAVGWFHRKMGWGRSVAWFRVSKFGGLATTGRRGGGGLECEGSEAVMTAEAGADAGRRQRRP